jgi:hypothetical protein
VSDQAAVRKVSVGTCVSRDGGLVVSIRGGEGNE